MRGFLATVVVLAAAWALPAAASASRSPSALLQALLTAKVPASKLPRGFSSPKVGSYPITAGDRTHHVVGGALVSTNGGGAEIIYLVFTTPAAARANFAHGTVANVFRISSPGGIPKPKIEFNTSATIKEASGASKTFGVTDLTFVFGNVLVETASTSPTSTTHGDVAGTGRLGLFALAHLKAVS